MRAASAISALAALACSSDPIGIGADGGAPDARGRRDAGADAGLELDAARALDLEATAFCHALADRYAARLDECGGGPAEHFRARFLDVYRRCDGVADDVLHARVQYSPAQAETCAAWLDGASCQALRAEQLSTSFPILPLRDGARALPTACRGVLAPALEVGAGPCQDDAECRDGAMCDVDPLTGTCSRRCVSPRQNADPRAPCDLWLHRCPDGYVCLGTLGALQSTEGECTQVVGEGAACGRDALCEAGSSCLDARCVVAEGVGSPCAVGGGACEAHGLTCVGERGASEGNCAIPRAAGERCEGRPGECDERWFDAFCGHTETSSISVCQTPGRPGEACGRYRPCETFSECREGVCVSTDRPRAAEGTACVADAECLSGRCLRAQCAPIPTLRREGVPCSHRSECLSGFCEDGICAPFGPSACE